MLKASQPRTVSSDCWHGKQKAVGQNDTKGGKCSLFVAPMHRVACEAAALASCTVTLLLAEALPSVTGRRLKGCRMGSCWLEDSWTVWLGPG